VASPCASLTDVSLGRAGAFDDLPVAVVRKRTPWYWDAQLGTDSVEPFANLPAGLGVGVVSRPTAELQTRRATGPENVDGHAMATSGSKGFQWVAKPAPIRLPRRSWSAVGQHVLAVGFKG